MDFEQHYAPVCREESWRILIIVALNRNMITRQYDIEGVFLNGPIQEEQYVRVIHATGLRVWRLRKSLYGTKQAAHNRKQVLDRMECGLERSCSFWERQGYGQTRQQGTIHPN